MAARLDALRCAADEHDYGRDVHELGVHAERSYSNRSNLTGSTRPARRSGLSDATKLASASVTQPASARASTALTSKSSGWRNLVAVGAAAVPSVNPIPAGHVICERASRRKSGGPAECRACAHPYEDVSISRLSPRSCAASTAISLGDCSRCTVREEENWFGLISRSRSVGITLGLR